MCVCLLILTSGIIPDCLVAFIFHLSHKESLKKRLFTLLLDMGLPGTFQHPSHSPCLGEGKRKCPPLGTACSVGQQCRDQRGQHSNVRGSENTDPLAQNGEVISSSFSLPQHTNISLIHLLLNTIYYLLHLFHQSFVLWGTWKVAILQEIYTLQPSGHNFIQKSPHCISLHGVKEERDDLRAKAHIQCEFWVENQATY